jgi:hypothetical protein
MQKRSCSLSPAGRRVLSRVHRCDASHAHVCVRHIKTQPNTRKRSPPPQTHTHTQHTHTQVEPPKDPETYIHRSGRTGRAGHTGVCITLVGRKHEERIPWIERKAGEPGRGACLCLLWLLRGLHVAAAGGA